MDATPQASFIPKAAMDSRSGASGAFVSLALLIAIFLFVASCVAAGAAFTYQRFLEGKITEDKTSLETAKTQFDPSTIQELVRTDLRINNAKTLLTNHVAPSALFSFLANNTLSSVQFSNFDYTLSENGAATISLQGQADSFATVALQSDLFGSNKLLKDVAFSGVSVTQTGSVNFSVKATLNPQVINYKQTLTATNTAPASAAVQPVATTTPGVGSPGASTTSALPGIMPK